MIRRQALKTVLKRLKTNPAAALLGPRQCGKTTLARSMEGHYFDLEREPERLRLDLEWEGLLSGKRLVILDEAQSWPEVFGRLRGAIDRDRGRMGRFLLLGSVSPTMMRWVSESLAGRLSIIELTPFILSELPDSSTTHLWLYGGYPDGGILKQKRYPRWQLDYLALLSQRDLPNWGLPAKPQVTERLLRMLAAMHGQTWNASQVGQSLGLSYQTVNGYLDFLEGAFLIRRLPPYQSNIRKRLVKTPKVYWRDSGLLHALFNVPDQRSLLAQPWVGASWEGFAIHQILAELTSMERPFTPYYFRTRDGYEIDLVLDFGGERWAVEVKLTASPGPDDKAKLDKAADMIRASKRFLVSKTDHPSGDDRFLSCNLGSFLKFARKHG